MFPILKNIALCCNPSSDNVRALKVTDTVAKVLAAKGISYSIFSSYWPQLWTNFTEAWVIGGDGTLFHFINQYTDFQLPIAAFAGGSGNDFHHMLYGDVGVEDQVENMLVATPHPIDAGMCNDKLFLNGVGVGFDGAIVKDLLGKKKEAGKVSYLFSILKNIFSYNEKECTISSVEKTIRQQCLLISVANGKRYGGGFMVAPNAEVTDGLLDVSIIGGVPKLKRMQMLPLLEKGEHLSLPYTTYLQDNKVIINAPISLPAHIDGEYFSSDVFDITCLPKRFSFLR